MIIKRQILNSGHNFDIDINVTPDARKFVFIYIPEKNVIVIRTNLKSDNHTELVRKTVGKATTGMFIWGGWAKEVNGKVMFFSKSRKYGNNILGMRIVRVLQKVFVDGGLKDWLHGLPRKRKLDVAEVFPHIINRLKRH